MENCHYCKKQFEADQLHENGAEHLICDNCSYERCCICEHGLPEVETRQGDYICADCYSSQCDAAYDNYKESLYD